MESMDNAIEKIFMEFDYLLVLLSPEDAKHVGKDLKRALRMAYLAGLAEGEALT